MKTRTDIVEHLAMAEASVWLARLQGQPRTPAMEAAFRAWLAEDAAHARAFASATDAWDIIPGAVRAAREAPGQERATTGGRWRLPALAACLVLAVAAGIFLPWRAEDTYGTGVGEQRTVALDDGTRVTLNTDTRLSVQYGGKERRVRLERGEALFEVVHNPQRPFIVSAGDGQVRALGTTFVVRNAPGAMDVLLIDGRVEVKRPVSGDASLPAQRIVLSPGERISLNHARRVPVVDRPSIEEAIAWQHGEAMFDNVSLAEAVAEINRYSRIQVRIDDPEVAKLRVSGVFATRDPVEFANVIARLHGLDVVPAGANIALVGNSRRK